MDSIINVMATLKRQKKKSKPILSSSETTAAYKRLSRRFQPRLGTDSRPVEYLEERKTRLLHWFKTQPWSPTFKQPNA